jgi:hypothetical protein
MSHIWSLQWPFKSKLEKRNFLKTSAIAGATFAEALVVLAALASANEPRGAVFQFTFRLQRDERSGRETRDRSATRGTSTSGQKPCFD